MTKAAFILIYLNNPVAVILCDENIEREDLIKCLKTPILEEVMGEEDGQFEIDLQETMPNWGETIDIKSVKYVQDGEFITDTEFSLLKSVVY